MDRKTRWRTIWLLLLTFMAVLVLLPSFVPNQSLPVWFQKSFKRKIQLGLDLQGGLHIVYSIDLNKAVDDKASEIKRDIEERLAERTIKGKVSTPLDAPGAVTVILDDAKDLAKIDKKSKFLADYDEVISFRDCPAGSAAGRVLCVRVASDYADQIKKSALEQAIRTVRERIDEKGISEPTVISKGDQIIVELPGLDDDTIGRVKTIIARTAKLEFKIVQENSKYMRDLYGHVTKDKTKAPLLGIAAQVDLWRHDESGRQYRDYYLTAKDRNEFFDVTEAKKRGCWDKGKSEFKGKVECKVTGRSVIADYIKELAASDKKFVVDGDHQLAFEFMRPEPGEDAREPFWRTYYLARQVELGGTSVASANVFWNPTSGRPEVLIVFNRWGGRRFGDLTAKNVGRKMAIILDDKVSSAPTIQGAIRGGRSTITMGGSNPKSIQTEAQDLVNVLRTGSLPAPLRMETESKVGPLLGRDAIKKTQFSFILGSLIVICIMVWVYRFAGFLSIIALVLNLTYMMAVLATFGATLTLPGIAALVLTVGMAVDANIIIYERIREELRAGKSVRGAVDAGFSRGFTAIIDGQLTTAAAAYVLMQYGSGPIRGFAVMLIIGIICTLFTTTWVARLLFEHWVGKGKKNTVISI